VVPGPRMMCGIACTHMSCTVQDVSYIYIRHRMSEPTHIPETIMPHTHTPTGHDSAMEQHNLVTCKAVKLRKPVGLGGGEGRGGQGRIRAP
jgi:hypothetical protein